MPIKSFADIDNMIASYKWSKNQTGNQNGNQNSYSFPAEGTYSRSSSTSSESNSHAYMSRSTRVIGAGDMLDENGYFNSSRQLLK